VSAAAAAVPSSAPQIDGSRGLVAAQGYGKLPMAFEENRGQLDDSVRFVARGRGYQMFLTPTEAVLALAAEVPRDGARSIRDGPRSGAAFATANPAEAVVRMRLAGANPRPQLSGVDRLPGNSNYLRGNDPAQWQRDVPNYAKVKYAAVYPGIDVVYYGNG